MRRRNNLAGFLTWTAIAAFLLFAVAGRAIGQGNWYDSCPGDGDCVYPAQATYVPNPTYTPEPIPTCIPTLICPAATLLPTSTTYPTSTPYPAQPTRVITSTVEVGIKGVWIQASSSSTTIRERIQTAASLGANTVYIFQGTGRGVTFANSQDIPFTDSLTAAIVEADRHGIVVIPAIPAKYFWREGYPLQDVYNRIPEADEHWLDFRSAEARDLIVSLVRDLTNNYDIGGVILDYIRWDRDWYRSAGLGEWGLMETVRLCHDETEMAGLSLHASVISIIYYDETYGAIQGYGQNWPVWLDNGYLDYAQPMTYHDAVWLQGRVQDWIATGHYPDRIYPVIAPVYWPSPDGLETAETLESWRAEMEYIYSTGNLNLALFDTGVFVRFPQFVPITVEIWGDK